MMARMDERVSQLPIVGEEQKPGGVLIESADREQPRKTVGRHQLRNATSIMRIGHSAQISCWLVEHEHHLLFGKRNARTIELHHSAGRIDLRAHLAHHFPVHAHPPRSDELLRSTPTRNARAREEFLEANRFHEAASLLFVEADRFEVDLLDRAECARERFEHLLVVLLFHLVAERLFLHETKTL